MHINSPDMLEWLAPKSKYDQMRDAELQVK
jgi:hypothetical protein